MRYLIFHQRIVFYEHQNTGHQPVICVFSTGKFNKNPGLAKEGFSVSSWGCFVKYGLNRQIMFLVGLAELFWWRLLSGFQGSYLSAIGALVILATSLGAIICHLIFDTWKDGIPAMLTLFSFQLFGD